MFLFRNRWFWKVWWAEVLASYGNAERWKWDSVLPLFYWSKVAIRKRLSSDLQGLFSVGECQKWLVWKNWRRVVWVVWSDRGFDPFLAILTQRSAKMQRLAFLPRLRWTSRRFNVGRKSVSMQAVVGSPPWSHELFSGWNARAFAAFLATFQILGWIGNALKKYVESFKWISGFGSNDGGVRLKGVLALWNGLKWSSECSFSITRVCRLIPLWSRYQSLDI